MTQLERIAHFESLLNRIAAAAKALDAALDEFEAVQSLSRELNAYYGGADWRGDLADDEAGRLPRDLPRGVLSEDAAYDALADNRRLWERLRALAGGGGAYGTLNHGALIL
jgi:hypothetical protein